MKTAAGFLMALAVAATSWMWPARQALAQTSAFPNHRFTMLVASGAGGTLDLMARMLADFMRRHTDQPIIVENRPGGSDTIAMTALVAAPADGHTIAFGGPPMIPTLFIKDMPYNAADVTPVSILSQTPYTVVASKASNFHNVKEFLSYAKANPGKVTFGSATGSHSLEMYSLMIALGFEGNVILYKGFAPVEAAVLTGEVNASIFGNIGKVKSGQIVGIVTGGDARNPDMPDVPTFKELGYNSYDPRAGYTVLARTATPPALMDRLVKECQDLVRTPEYTARITNGLGIPAVGSTHEYAAKYNDDYFLQLKAAADRYGVKPQ
jgi:tripartite-type tricarboxylate transporter receptor subunit TctC